MEADAVLFVPVVKQGKLSFCCLVCGIVSENSSIFLLVFVMADQRMLWFTSICFGDAFPSNNFSHVGDHY